MFEIYKYAVSAPPFVHYLFLSNSHLVALALLSKRGFTQRARLKSDGISDLRAALNAFDPQGNWRSKTIFAGLDRRQRLVQRVAGFKKNKADAPPTVGAAYFRRAAEGAPLMPARIKAFESSQDLGMKAFDKLNKKHGKLP